MENEHFPDPTGLRARIEQWTFGLYPACIKYLMSAFDVPEVSNVLCFVSILINQRSDLKHQPEYFNIRWWRLPGPTFANMEWNHFPEAELLSIMLLSSFTFGSSQLLSCLWYLEATCISASTGSTYILMKLSLHSALPITNLSPVSTS